MEPNYQLKRLSVRAMMARRATAAEAKLIRRDWASLADASGLVVRAPGTEPLWLMNERSRTRPGADDRGLLAWRP